MKRNRRDLSVWWKHVQLNKMIQLILMTTRSTMKLMNLSFELILPHLQVRAQMENIPRTLKTRLHEICGTHEVLEPDEPRQPGRCSVCSSKKNRKTRFSCRKCDKFLCLEHIVVACEDCFEINGWNFGVVDRVILFYYWLILLLLRFYQCFFI